MVWRTLKGLFESVSDESAGAETHEHALRVATAALLVEMARADFEEDADEHALIETLLRGEFALDAGEARALLSEAGADADGAVSLHEFTSALHAHLSERDKIRVIEMLWRVALADGQIDKYEEYLVRKVADLLYVRHRDLVRARHHVEGSE